MSSTQEWEFPSYTPTIHRAVYPAIDPSNKANSAAGKVVIVTGGGAGIGKNIANAFVTAGAKAVTILGRRENVLLEAKKELEGKGTAILTFVADVLDEKALNAAFAETAKQFGGVDVAVANAGYLATPALAADADVDDYFKAFEINIKGTLLTFRAFVASKSSNKTSEPVFISVNTAGAHAGLFPQMSSYAASKMGQAHMVSHFQAEYPDVRVVQFHPGVIATDMNVKSGLPLSQDDMSLPSSFAVWLASPNAAWTKGLFFWAHWDVDELAAKKEEIQQGQHLTMGLKGWPQVEKPVVA